MGGSRNQHWAVVEKKDLGGTHHLMSGLEYASAKSIVQSRDSQEGV